MTETTDQHEQCRRILLAHPVPVFAEGVEPAAALAELARRVTSSPSCWPTPTPSAPAQRTSRVPTAAAHIC